MLQIVLEMQYNDGVQAAEEKNKALEKQAEAMRLSILGTNEESRDDKPLGVVEAYVKENTTELIDPLRAEKRVAELKKRRRDCCLNWKQRSRSPIVVSSSWRQVPTAYEHLKEWLEKYGMEIHDRTPYVYGERGDDITSWFNSHPGEYRYVILDDDDDMGEHMEHLVRTDFDTGLTEEEADECIRRLGKKLTWNSRTGIRSRGISGEFSPSATGWQRHGKNCPTGGLAS